MRIAAFFLCLFLSFPVSAQFNLPVSIDEPDIRIPENLLTFDADNDGEIDVFAFSPIEKKMVWYKNAGNLDFASAAVVGTGEFLCVKAVDFNNDGFTDILASTPVAIGWIMNNGGSFSAFELIVSATYVRDFMVADVDKDSDHDILGQAGKELLLWRNTGVDFISEILNESLYSISGLKQADYNADGFPEFFFHSAGRLSYFSNNNGTFSSEGTYMDGQDIEYAHLRPFLKKKLISVTSGKIYFSVHPDSILSRTSMDIPTGSFFIDPLDAEGDGDTDILLSKYHYNTHIGLNYLLVNDGLGNFALDSIIDSDYFLKSVADFDGDGKDELVAVQASHTYLANNKIFVLNYEGAGRFSGKNINYGISVPSAVAIADIDNSGNREIIASFSEEGILKRYVFSDSKFQGEILSDSIYGTPFLSDLNKDNLPELIIASNEKKKVYGFKNQNGLLVDPTQIIPDTFSFHQVKILDLNNDSFPEVVFSKVYMGNTIYYMENLGGVLSEPTELLFTSPILSFDLGKPDSLSQPFPDVLIAGSNDSLILLKNQGNFQFSDEELIDPDMGFLVYETEVLFEDLDGDLKVDIIGKNSSSANIYTYRNVGSGKFKKGVQSVPGNGTFPADHIETGYVNDAGGPELLATDDVYGLLYLYSNLAGNFQNKHLILNLQDYNLGISPGGFKVVTDDINNDNFEDLIIFDPGYVAFKFLENGGDKKIRTKGKVFLDLNEDCQYQSNEPGLANVLLNMADTRFYGYSDEEGVFEILSDSAESYNLTYSFDPMQSRNISDRCKDTVDINGTKDTSGIYIGVKGYPCQILDISIRAIRFRRCFGGQTVINFRNLGLAEANNLKLHVSYPSKITPLSSLPAWDSKVDSVLTFNIASLPSGGYGAIYLHDSVSCADAGDLGKIQCIKASITPDFYCHSQYPEWNRAQTRVTGSCSSEGAAIFEIRNISAVDMSDSLDYRIFYNDTLGLSKKYLLHSGESILMKVSSPGKTIRLEADQPEGFPGGGKAIHIIEDCGGDQSKSYFLSFTAPKYYQDDMICLPIAGSYDPNEKHQSPSGYSSYKLIQPGEPLDYRINFQNTGTDTAFTVIITDTLSPFFDLKTLRVLESSHHANFSISHGVSPVLIWKFEGINLPDSSVSYLQSQGFVSYSIYPAPQTPMGTRITNKAAIYFDFNEPVITNQTYFYLWDQYYTHSGFEDNVVLITGLSDAADEAAYSVMPNPFTDNIGFKLPRNDDWEIIVFDIHGKQVYTSSFYGSRANCNLSFLPSGIYLIRFMSSNGEMYRRKIVRK